MASTGFASFDETVQQTNEILKEIETPLGWEDRRDRSYGILRATLQTLRDRLPVNEAVNFSAQLPMLIRGFYFEGWDVSKAPEKMDRDEFLQKVKEKFPFDTEENIADLVKIVMTVILVKVFSPDEAEKIKNLLPDDMADFF